MSTIKEFNDNTELGFWAAAGPAYAVVLLFMVSISLSVAPEGLIIRAYVKKKLAKEKTDDVEIQR